MDLNLSEQQEMLLLKACQDNHGTLTMETARRLYSSKNSAKSAVQKLESLNYIEKSGIGAFKVKKVTRDVEELLEDEQFSEEDSGDSANNNSSSDYVAKTVS
jgi:Mn-dependent DtxR family transcriptional regulator